MSNPFNTTNTTNKTSNGNGHGKTTGLSEEQLISAIKPMLAAGTTPEAIGKGLGPQAKEIALKLSQPVKTEQPKADDRPLRVKVEEALAQGATAKDVAELYGNVAGQMAELLGENTALKAKRAAEAKKDRKLTLKIAEKGGISVYGVGRFPTTLYRTQWEFLLEGCSGGIADKIRTFIAANIVEITRREEASKAAKDAAE